MTGVARSLFPSLPSPGSYNHDVITLLLIRHGIAEDGKGPDAERALSAEGWEKSRAAMKGLVRRGYVPTRGVSSPYRRAAETMVCLQEAAGRRISRRLLGRADARRASREGRGLGCEANWRR